MSAPTDQVLQATLGGLEQGLTVATVATVPFQTCDGNAIVTEILTRPDLLDFDHIPVKQRGQIVGVLERDSQRPIASADAKGAMRPLDSSMLVATSASIERLLPLMKAKPYRLVVDGGTITGIVTPSDLLKLPVRLFAFALVAHLEVLMIRVIDGKYRSWEEWRDHLDEKSRRTIGERQKRLSADRLNPEILELTSVGEKQKILVELGLFGERFWSGIDDIRCLRNDIAHQRTYASNKKELKTFVNRVERTRAIGSTGSPRSSASMGRGNDRETMRGKRTNGERGSASPAYHRENTS